MSSGDFGDEHPFKDPAEFEAQNRPPYLDHWYTLSKNSMMLGYDPESSEGHMFSVCASLNAGKLENVDAYLQYLLAAQEEDQFSRTTPVQPELADMAIYVAGREWYGLLGSFNRFGDEKIMQTALRTAEALEGLLNDQSLSEVDREQAGILAATLYHELALGAETDDAYGRQLFAVMCDQALGLYEQLLYSDGSKPKVEIWREQNGDASISPERARGLMETTARKHDLLFEQHRRNMFGALGSLNGDIYPGYSTRVEHKVRVLQRNALSDLLKFLALDRRDTATGQWLLPNHVTYKWFAELGIRTDQITSDNGSAALNKIGQEQIRMAFSREAAPDDSMEKYGLLNMSFDVMAYSYDMNGRQALLPEPGKLREHGRRASGKKSPGYVKVISQPPYTDTNSSAGLYLRAVSRPRMIKETTQQLDLLRIKPNDTAAVQARRRALGSISFSKEINP